MGLALHDKGKVTLAKGNHKAALEELMLSEEAFCLANPDLLTHVDNMAMLLLDIVWCVGMGSQPFMGKESGSVSI
jgi:hypothetical protein